MKVCSITKGKKSALGAEELLYAVGKMLGEKSESLVQAMQKLSVEKVIFAPFCFDQPDVLQKAQQLKVPVCVSDSNVTDVRMLDEVEKLKKAGIATEFLKETPPMQILQAEEAVGEDFSALVVLGAIEQESEQVAWLSCNIDDSTGEELGWAMEQLLEAGAKDVFFTPIQMKKNRPAVMLNVLCGKGEEQKFAKILMRETSTIGVRWSCFHRAVMRRQAGKIDSPWGELDVKRCSFGEIHKTTIEYESAKRAAREYGCPVGKILRYSVDE